MVGVGRACVCVCFACLVGGGMEGRRAFLEFVDGRRSGLCCSWDEGGTEPRRLNRARDGWMDGWMTTALLSKRNGREGKHQVTNWNSLFLASCQEDRIRRVGEGQRSASLEGKGRDRSGGLYHAGTSGRFCCCCCLLPCSYLPRYTCTFTSFLLAMTE